VATVQKEFGREGLSPWDFFYAVDMGIACLISYSISTYVLAPFVATPDGLLGGHVGQRCYGVRLPGYPRR